MGTAASTHVYGSLCAVALAMTACGASPQHVAPPLPPAHSLPVWNGDLAAAFDDSIERVALDAAVASAPESDAWFGPRAQGAECVAKVKVVSTTTVGLGTRQSYLLTLRVIGQPLVGALPADEVEVPVHPESPFYAMAKVHDVKLTGRTFVGFFKRFNVSGAAAVHWYLTGDSRDVREAVSRSRALSDVGYRQVGPRM